MGHKAAGPIPARSCENYSAGRTLARLSRWTELALAQVELTMPQFRLLALLADGSTAAKGLASGLDVSPPTVTALVDGLVERGLVERVRSEVDRRRVDHRLTDEGRRALVRADSAVAAQLEDLAAHLRPADARRAEAGLEQWAHALDAKRDEFVREHL